MKCQSRVCHFPPTGLLFPSLPIVLAIGAACSLRLPSVLLARTRVHPHTPCALCFLIDTR
eukprot:COSAG01_NODE_50735_length_360_cov_1941.429119_1_plen_59_part_10